MKKIIPKMKTLSNGYKIGVNFEAKEFFSGKSGGATWRKYGINGMKFLDIRMLENIQAIRQELGALSIHAAFDGGEYRGYQSKSQHRLGKACDFHITGKTIEETRQWILDNYQRLPHPEIRVELETATWVHIDTGGIEGKVITFKP